MSATVYGQDIVLLKNFNPKAKELHHSLNASKDSLVVKSETKILSIDIFNEDFETSINVEGFESRISIEELPEGKFVVEARLNDKIIIFGLYRPNFTENHTLGSASSKTEEVAEGNGMMLDEKGQVIKCVPNKSIAFLLTRENNKSHHSKSQKFYWVVTKVNNEMGSNKTMKLVEKETVDRMISKHKQELNSVSGKLNELTVWEVYNTTKFMELQMSDPNFFYSVTSEVFNTTPYYSTHNTVANL